MVRVIDGEVGAGSCETAGTSGVDPDSSLIGVASSTGSMTLPVEQRAFSNSASIPAATR